MGILLGKIKNFMAKELILLHLGSSPGGKYGILATCSFFKMDILMKSHLQKEEPMTANCES